MKLLGYRHVTVSGEDQMVDFLENEPTLSNSYFKTEKSPGTVFKRENSWLELWTRTTHMPEKMMLQLIVDDADEFARYAKTNGVVLHGPMEEDGKRIYSIISPGRMPVTIQSAI
ncbi:hypothetical protein [Halobacillus sp. BBL2006]|uniref:hypothetical protein n=1 Tax=Halobacillus sp. BBL2006 TaxID=1543706 RepID=UPI000543D077|nr:hypothetical protein [Halobacillus sp. BBL2006]KHE68565.1 hypothetical protein LD39_14385 [Halobacillus sp. BBL2006]